MREGREYSSQRDVTKHHQSKWQQDSLAPYRMTSNTYIRSEGFQNHKVPAWTYCLTIHVILAIFKVTRIRATPRIPLNRSCQAKIFSKPRQECLESILTAGIPDLTETPQYYHFPRSPPHVCLEENIQSFGWVFGSMARESSATSSPKERNQGMPVVCKDVT